MSRKTQCQKILKNGGKALNKFCENTSIHGLKYITEDNSHWTKRVMWVLVFATSIYFSGYFCQQMWNKWRDSPVLMSLDSNHYPLKNIPFPAVTVCSVNKASKTKLLRVLQEPRYKDVNYNVMQQTLRYMTKLDRAINNKKELDGLAKYYRSMNITPADLFDVLKKTAPSCQNLIIDCIWLRLPKPCYKYFTLLPTDDGMCCTFNGAKYNDHELHIESNNTREPLRVNGNGYRMGLSLVLDADITDYSVTNGKFYGFKILVHPREHFPDVSDRGFVLGPGTETYAAIKGVRTFNTEDVAIKVSPEKRQCRVKEDLKGKLKYFQHYSQSGCLIECTLRHMQEKCHCRPYFFRGDNKTKLCDLDSYVCLANVSEDVRQRDEELCHCLPPCTNTWYDPEISYASFPGRAFNLTRTYKRMVAAHNLSTESSVRYIKSNLAVLHVFYKDKTGMLYKTDIRFGVEDFISAMGGLLGLGLGLSFISVFEIIYFFILRWVFPSTKSSKSEETDEQSTPLLKKNEP